jgi:hypothetical protein
VDEPASLESLSPSVYVRVTAVERRLADRQYIRWLTKLDGSTKYLDPQAEAVKAAYMFALYLLWYFSVPLAFVGGGMLSLRSDGVGLLVGGLVLIGISVVWGAFLLTRWRRLRPGLPGSAKFPGY